MTAAADLDRKFEKIVALMRSTTHAGERSNARAAAEAVAKRAGMRFDEAIALVGGRRRKHQSKWTLYHVHDLNGLRGVVHRARRLSAFDSADRNADGKVVVSHYGRIVATVDCANDALAYAAEMICTSVIIRREYEAWEADAGIAVAA